MQAADAGLRESIMLADGEVAVYRWPGPEGAPELHWAHANGFNGLTYRTLLAPLAGRLTIIATDLRGHGRTTLPAEPGVQLSWSAHGRDLARVLDALGNRPRLLAGHSMGAVASLIAADERPELCAGLLLVEPVIQSDTARWRAAALRRLRLIDRHPLVAGALRRRTRFESAAQALAAYRGRGAFRTWDEATLADYLEGGLRPAREGEGVELACAPAFEAANYRLGPPAVWAAMSRLKAPATLVHGGRQSTVSPRVAAGLKRMKPDLRIVLVPRAGHFLPMEAPDLVRGEILRLADAAAQLRRSSPARSASPDAP